jgi:hypothetical protein
VSCTIDRLCGSCALPLSLSQSQSWFEAHFFVIGKIPYAQSRRGPPLAAHPRLADWRRYSNHLLDGMAGVWAESLALADKSPLTNGRFYRAIEAWGG